MSIPDDEVAFDATKIPKSWLKKRWICLGAVMGYTVKNQCGNDCCGHPHLRYNKSSKYSRYGMCTGLHQNTKTGPTDEDIAFSNCDCYIIETAIKLAMKIKMGLAHYYEE